MSTTSQLSGIIRGVLTQPTGGIAGLVDSLLVVCREHGLQLEWQPNRCRFRSHGGDWGELTAVPLRKSVFRAILARFATLCNERTANTVSPYGGQYELSAGADSPIRFRIKFTNTPTEQRLELVTEAAPSTQAPPTSHLLKAADEAGSPIEQAESVTRRHIMCDLCGSELLATRDRRSVVRVEVYKAAVEPQAVEELENETDTKAGGEQLNPDKGEEEEQESIFRYDLCESCMRQFIRDPLGNTYRAKRGAAADRPRD